MVTVGFSQFRSEARNYLQRIRNINFRIQQLEEEEKMIDRNILKAQTYDKDLVQTSPRADGLENMVIKYIGEWSISLFSMSVSPLLPCK